MAKARPVLPTAFLEAQRQKKIIKAFARLVRKKGYEATKIADIVRRAGVARKTLYDNFEGKGAIARAVVTKVCPSWAETIDLDDKNSALRMLAIELAAEWEVGGQADAIRRAQGMCSDLRALPASIAVRAVIANDPLDCSLPPGRHGLPREFVIKNQQHRLLTALASCFSERGYNATTVAHITKSASVSRRTFYEHFDDKEAAALALMRSVSVRAADLGADLDQGWGALVVEVVAVGVSSEVDAVRRARNVEGLLRSFVEHLEETNTPIESGLAA
jgi:AcrR family transcriptional regulator